MTGRAPPEVTIGLPVYNGETHLRAAVDSLLAQTFGDFELLISDNGSEDCTQRICEDYARRDARVRYVRHATNRGAVFNWNYVAYQAQSPFFKWAGGNDVVPPQMLERCVAVLRARPDVALCYGNTALIDNAGTVFGTQLDDPEVLDASASTRFIRILNELICNNAQSGLIRMSALRRTRFERNYLDGDMVLMAELALYGGYRKLDEILLHRRQDRGAFSMMLPDAERQQLLTARRPQRGSPLVKRHADRVWSVLRARIPFGEKRRALSYALRSIYWDRGNIARSLRNPPVPQRNTP
jgi:glycosyltransferase involved in cell wall biosynthesis